MVDVSKIRTGDKITVRHTVTAVRDDRVFLKMQRSDGLEAPDTYVSVERITAHEPAPRPIEVGSLVTWGGGAMNWDVTAISGQRAWLTRDERDIVMPLAGLRHAD